MTTQGIEAGTAKTERLEDESPVPQGMRPNGDGMGN